MSVMESRICCYKSIFRFVYFLFFWLHLVFFVICSPCSSSCFAKPTHGNTIILNHSSRFDPRHQRCISIWLSGFISSFMDLMGYVYSTGSWINLLYPWRSWSHAWGTSHKLDLLMWMKTKTDRNIIPCADSFFGGKKICRVIRRPRSLPRSELCYG